MRRRCKMCKKPLGKLKRKDQATCGSAKCQSENYLGVIKKPWPVRHCIICGKKITEWRRRDQITCLRPECQKKNKNRKIGLWTKELRRQQVSKQRRLTPEDKAYMAKVGSYVSSASQLQKLQPEKMAVAANHIIAGKP